MCCMFKMHHFEFRRTSKNLSLYFLFDILSYGLIIWMFTCERFGIDNNFGIVFLYLINFP